MALKDLFGKKSLKTVPSKNLEQIKEEIESADLLKNKVIVDTKVIPRVDYTDPKNFTFYGSAKKYYEESLTNIYGYYPFDGSAAEKIKWEADASYLDIHLLENEYPSSVGHAEFGHNYSRTGTSSNGYYNTSNKEYVVFSSGPNTGSLSMKSSPIHDNFSKSNVLDIDSNQESNLSFSGSKGATIQFWLKKDTFSTESDKQVVCDFWNGKAHGQNDYCRFRVEIHPNVSGNENKLVLELMSGSSGAEYIPLESGITISDNNWHHYSISVKNEANKINAGLYVNGELSSTSVTGSAIASFKGSIKGHIGSLLTSVSGTYGALGHGKLSGSIDDFRFWKIARTNKQIGENWRVPVHGGSNTDLESGTELTLYYKFNEGIYDENKISSYDKKVLDYSGRTTIGHWVGYTTSSRKTTSAFVESGVLSSEKKDPIMYSTHPDVSALSTRLKSSGSIHDDQNNTNFFKSLPSWIVDEDDSDLENLTQIMSSYLDELHLQVKTLPEIKNLTYPSGSEKVYPFGKQLLASQGMEVPELFVDSNLLEYISDRSDKVVFEEKLNTTKNMIYQNIYNNLVYLYRSKGTEKSIRNITRCFGINEDLLKMNMYSNNSLFTFDENYKQKSIAKRYADFNYPDRFGATIYQMTSSTSQVERSFITGTMDSAYDAHTLQGEFIFPKKYDFKHSFFFDTPFTQVSLMGVDSADGDNPASTQWPASNSDFSIYAIRDQINSSNVYFQLTSSTYAVDLRTSTFRGVYDNEKWNIAMRVKPKKYPYANFVSGSTNKYVVEFYGVNHNFDSKQNEFSLSTEISSSQGESYLRGNKRVYAGARRQNNTGSLLHNCDALVSSIRYWDSYLSDTEISEHSKDPTIFGPKLASKGYRIQSSKIKANSLLLSWDFDTVKTSDASGEFIVTDISSGSIDSSATYADSFLFELSSGDLTPIAGSPSGTDTVFEISSGAIQPLASPVSDMLWDVVGDEIMPAEARTTSSSSKTTLHNGRAFSFPASSSKVVNKEYMSVAKKNLPEIVNGDHMIKVLSNDDEFFSRTASPEEFFFSLEKSMYSSVSEEMIKTVSNIKDFNNLVGEPVNKYRSEYKELTKMRREFFENVENEPDVENFLEYYKWIDDSVTEIVKQFLPYSADVVESNANIIESHIFERSKYQHQYPALEERVPSISSPAKGAGDFKYSWSRGHAPVSELQTENCQWWNERAEKNNAKIVDGAATARQSLFNSLSNTYKKERDKAAILVVDNVKQLSDNINAVDYAVKETTFGSGDYLLIESADVVSENIECEREITPDKKIKFGFALKKTS